MNSTIDSPTAKFRVAVTSSDGRMVDEHFGNALQFVVLDVDAPSVQYVETRPNKPACGNSSQSGAAADSIAIIADCQVLLTVRAGPPMVAKINAQGIRVQFAKGSIKEALDQLLDVAQ